VLLASDASCQDQVFWVDGDTLCVDCAEIAILEEIGEVHLSGFLKGIECTFPKAHGLLGDLVGNLTHHALEGKLSYERIGIPLEAADLTQRNLKIKMKMEGTC